MSSLRKLQRQFLDAMQYPASSDVFAFVEGRGLSPTGRVAIYRNNVQQGLLQALRATYPVVGKLVGSDYFDQLAREYAGLTPSTSGNLEDYGGSFGDFVDNLYDLHRLGYLGDIARLEWAMQEACQAASPRPLGQQQLSGLSDAPIERLAWQTSASTRLLVSCFPIWKIWKANQEEGDLAGAVSLEAGGVRLLVVQRGLRVEVMTLGAADFALLAGCRDGAVLIDAFEAAAEIDPNLDLAASLDKFIRQGVLDAWCVRPIESCKESCDASC